MTAKRIELDKYYTPDSAIDSLLGVLNMEHCLSFLEPCVGSAAIYDKIDCTVKCWAEIDTGVDYLTTSFDKVDLIVTNPPFSHALPFLQKSLAEAHSVFYLLRLNFLGSQKRRSFWNQHKPTHVLVLSQRPCFAWICRMCGSMYRPQTATTCSCGVTVKAQTDSI